MKSAILLAAALTVGATQTPNQALAGMWTAEHAGQTFVRLELQVTGNTISGRISLGDVEVDKTGALKAATAATRPPTPILDVAERAGKLTFGYKDGRETDRFEFTLIDETTARLQFLLTDNDRKDLASEGISDFKPFMLKKLVRK